MSDWTGGAIKDDGSALDIKFLDLSTVSMSFNLSTEGKLTECKSDWCHPSHSKKLLSLSRQRIIISYEPDHCE